MTGATHLAGKTGRYDILCALGLDYIQVINACPLRLVIYYSLHLIFCLLGYLKPIKSHPVPFSPNCESRSWQNSAAMACNSICRGCMALGEADDWTADHAGCEGRWRTMVTAVATGLGAL